MIKEFQNPSNRFRPIPFWSWNDQLEEEELKFQIKEMKKAGIGGYFMHARSGLKTDYLSDEWFRCIRAGIESAKEENMEAWIYDEEGWPSGFAGGIVPAMSEDFHAKFMTLEHHHCLADVDRNQVIALYCLNKNNWTYRRMDGDEDYKCSGEEEILSVRKHSTPFYIDTLNKRAVLSFLQCTHDVYYEKFGEDFGTYMKGFFTDEPRLTCNNFGDLAWSDDLPPEFKMKYGYDILENLPALFLKTKGYEKYRYDFWETVSRMFSENYMKTIYEWCEVHGCKATGHIMMEESIFSQMTSTAGVMPFYEYMHVPGIDWLRRMISSPIIGKQVGSVACQLGKKQVLTESFALCGWDVSFEELKWIAEWQFVNGVNQICQHLMAYTIKGVRKRDYPPSHFTQQTWWGEARIFHDYLSRLCAALSEGDQTADVLLLHPMRSGYVTFDGTRTEEIKRVDEEFTKISECLSGNHISYHFGDETIIKKYGSIANGLFQVGRIRYRTVIMPHMAAIDICTVKLLLEFAEQGGKILSLGQLPTFTNDTFTNDTFTNDTGGFPILKQLKEKVQSVSYDHIKDNHMIRPTQMNEVRDVMEREGLLSVSITDQQGEIESIHYQQRETELGQLFFLVNLSNEKCFEATLRIKNRKGQLLHFSAEDGEIRKIPFYYDRGDTCVNLSFEHMQSYLLVLEEGEFEPLLPVIQEEIRVKTGSHFVIDAMSHNSMTLDYCSYRIDGGEWKDRISVIHLQNLLLKLQRQCKVEMCFDFEVRMDLTLNQEFYLAAEDLTMYSLEVNGQKAENNEDGWWKDKSFRKTDIKKYLRQGSNQIILGCDFKQPQKVYDVLYGDNVYETEINKITYDVELENIYLVGDFGVISKSGFTYGERKALLTKGPFEIVDAPQEINSNNFTDNGLLFFAGDMEISRTFSVNKEAGKRIILELNDQKAPLVHVSINGTPVKDSLWAPYEADITDAAVDGENTLSLHIYASNRNLLGPHHHIDGECYNVGPESFTGKWSWVERKSEADATDVSDPDKNYWTDTYCFVEFGIGEKRLV